MCFISFFKNNFLLKINSFFFKFNNFLSFYNFFFFFKLKKKEKNLFFDEKVLICKLSKLFSKFNFNRKF